MKEFDFNTDAIKINFNGVSYSVRYPTVEDTKHQMDNTGDNKVDSYEQTIALLEKLGLPQEVSRALRVPNFNLICNELFNVQVEKKS